MENSVFDMIASIANASAQSLKSGYDLGFKEGFNQGYGAGLKKAEEIADRVFAKKEQVKDGE